MDNPIPQSSTAEMLAAIRSEKQALKKRVALLDEREKVVEGWVAEEQDAQQELPHFEKPRFQRRRPQDLGAFLRRVMADGKPRTNAELGTLAATEGIVSEHVDLRSIHSLMMSMMNAGEVERQTDNKWVISS